MPDQEAVVVPSRVGTLTGLGQAELPDRILIEQAHLISSPDENDVDSKCR